MQKQRLLTVILNYKTPEMTLEAVAAARVAMQGIEGEIVVVDNHSQDGSFEKIGAHITAEGWSENPHVRVVQSGRNGGFGAGNNFGIRAGLSDGSKPDLIYILNSDAFPAADAIAKLVTILETNPKAGFAGSYIHGPSGEPHITAFRFPGIASELEGAAKLGLISRLLGRYAVPLPLPDRTQAVDWLAGASMLMRSEVLDQIGLFDEAFFLYFEETDLCLRAHKAGWQVIYVRDSAVAHIGSVSTGMKSWARVPGYWFDSRLHYFTKNYGHLYATMATIAHIIGAIIWRLKRMIKRVPPAEPSHFLRNLTIHYLKSFAIRRTSKSRSHPGPSSGKAENRTGG
ncbi:MAG: glycosyltransferase family 2 protein [Rhodobacteraceae bacterium]|nr:glycosyltransferase family 2 protein [Paracoccaceae bacterium]